MKERCPLAVLAFVMLLGMATMAAGQNQHGGMHGAAGAAAYPGVMIGMNHLDGGWMMTYQLLDMKQRSELMKGMEGMDMPGMSTSPDITNHLMVFIQGPDGKLASGKVGFQIIGPDGQDQKTLTMGMSGGYGADVILKAKGIYTIKTKALIGDRTILDELLYDRK